MTSILKAIILPPASLLLLLLVGLWSAGRGFRLGRALAITSAVLLYILSTPLFSTLAIRLLEPAYSDPQQAPDVQAIVVLGGGTLGPAPEFGFDAVNALTLTRLRYAARLQRLTGKPVLVSGGSNGKASPEARQMRAILTEELKVPVRWVEERSVNTYTNALESQRILAAQGISRIYLVTHSWHMPRARLAFEHAGFSVVSAPTAFTSFDPAALRLGDVLPRASSLLNSYYFFHEILGYAVYALRIRLSPGPSGVGNEDSR